MRYNILFIFTFILICCTQQNRTNNYREPDLSQESKLIKVKKSVTEFVKSEWLKDASSYKPISWGQLDTVDAVDFKYKIAHQYMAISQFYTKTRVIDSLIENDMTFLLDQNFKVNHLVATKEYANHYDKDGLDYKMYGSKELQKLGIVNSYDMIFFENGKNKLLLVGGREEMVNTLHLPKEKWVDGNLRGAKIDLLSATDTVEYCEDLTENDCKYILFKEGKLDKIVKAP